MEERVMTSDLSKTLSDAREALRAVGTTRTWITDEDAKVTISIWEARDHLEKVLRYVRVCEIEGTEHWPLDESWR